MEDRAEGTSFYRILVAIEADATRFHGADRDMIQEVRKEYQEAQRRHRAQRKDGGE